VDMGQPGLDLLEISELSRVKGQRPRLGGWTAAPFGMATTTIRSERSEYRPGIDKDR
jgi:hypothetical protein